MAERQPLFIISTGKKGLGKTYQTCKLIEEYITPIVHPTDTRLNRPGRSVLIMDTNQEYSNDQLARSGFRFRTKVLALKDLPAWVAQSKIEVRRILPFDETGRPLTISEQAEYLGIVIAQFKGGAIVLEDISKYVGNSTTIDLAGAICSNRHRDQDIILNLQSASRILPVFYQNINYLRFHYQNDDCYRFRERTPNSEVLLISQLLVNAQYFQDDGVNNKKRFFVWISYDNEKISGAFSKNMYKTACREYLKKYNQAMVRQEAFGFKGDKNAHEKAIEACVDILMKYYGN